MSGCRCLLEEANREWRVANRANSLLAIRYSLLATSYSLLATRYSLLATRYSLPPPRYSLLATRYSLLATRYSLLATRYSLLATRYSLLAIHQLRKQLRIHIAAGKDADHHLATNIAKAVEFTGEQRGEPDGAARLHHQLQFVKRIAHRSCYLRIACRDAGADQFAIDRKGQLARRVTHQRVADGAAHARIGLAPPALKRAQRVVETFRLDRVELGRRHARLDAERNAGRQSAARGADHHDLGLEQQLPEILDDLSADGALPGDDQRIVVRRHQGGAALGYEPRSDRRAIFRVALVRHDLGAERRGALAFETRRVARHDDSGVHAEQRCGRRHALRVVAGRIGHH